MWDLIQNNRRKSVVLIFLLAAVLLGLGYAIGYTLDPSAGIPGVAVAMALWVIMMLVSVTGGEAILLASAGAREVTHNVAPQLFNIVEEMKIAAGLPAMPRVYVIESDVPNAFAVGLNPKRAAVAVTTGLMARLNRDELQGVVAHEIGHIANRDTLFMTLAGVTVGAVIMLADLYLRGMRYGLGGRRRSSGRGSGQAALVMFVIALVLAILAPILAQLLYFACSRRREYLADASGAQFTRYPEGLASALEKLMAYPGGRLEVNRAVAPMFTVNPLAAAGSVSTIFSTHPPTQDRIRVLRAMAKDASLAAYEEAYRATHRNHAIVGARNLAGSVAAGIRPPGPPEPETGAAKRWIGVNDVMNRVSQFSAIICPCGLKMKLPPGFDQKTVVCPRCGTKHDTSGAVLLAAAAAAGAAAQATHDPPPMRPIYRS